MKYKIKYIFPGWDNHDYSARYFYIYTIPHFPFESSSIFVLSDAPWQCVSEIHMIHKWFKDHQLTERPLMTKYYNLIEKYGHVPMWWEKKTKLLIFLFQSIIHWHYIHSWLLRPNVFVIQCDLPHFQIHLSIVLQLALFCIRCLWCSFDNSFTKSGVLLI